MNQSISQSSNVDPRSDAEYHKYLDILALNTEAKPGPWFRAGVNVDLWARFLSRIDPALRQHYTCRCCEHFVQMYGNLVCVADDGSLCSVIWDPEFVIEELKEAVGALKSTIESGRTLSPFYSEKKILGVQSNVRKRDGHVWRHFCAHVPSGLVVGDKVGTEEGRVSSNHGQVRRVLGRYTIETIDMAVAVLRAEGVNRSEKFIGPAEFLAKMKRMEGKQLHGLFWRELALAPDGFCHPNTSMIGQLLDAIQSGTNFDQAVMRFNSKVEGNVFQRPTAAPTAGAIEAAEKLFAEKGWAASLKRRYARLDEIVKIWPSPVDVTGGQSGRMSGEGPNTSSISKKSGGLFDHLKSPANKPPEITLKTENITWSKFKMTVLPAANEVYYLTTGSPDSFVAIVTAEDSAAPPIIQWDLEEARNTFSWYHHKDPKICIRWNLPAYTQIRVNAFCDSVPGWFGNTATHHGGTPIAILEGCKETHRDGGLALFPEILRSELHPVSAVIEAHSNKGLISGLEEASACGVAIPGALSRFVVKCGSLTRMFRIDRMD